MSRRRPDAGLTAWARRYPCTVPPASWVCRRGHGHNGPCAARPRWWNLAARARVRGAVTRPRMHDEEARVWVAVLGAVLVLAAFAVAMAGVR